MARREREDPHSHCTVCMKRVPEDTHFCSEECEERFKGDIAASRRKWYISLIPFAVFAATSALTIYMFVTLVLLKM